MAGTARACPLWEVTDHSNNPRRIVMIRIRHIRRLAAALAGALLAFAGAAPPALARPAPPRPPGWPPHPPGWPPLPPGWNKHPPLPPRHISQIHIVVIGGMPGWQIALIAAGAALLAAATAVLVYRAWATRRNPVTTATEPTVAGADAQLLSAP
jgi:ABC-type Fe3+-siderophore transport system permease subunit